MDQRPLSMPLVHWAMANACRTDDVTLMSQCFSAAQRADSSVTLKEALQAGLRKSVKEAAMACISYVLDQGADLGKLDPGWLIGGNSTHTSIRKVLEILVARGFNINSQSSCLPVLWYVGVADHELVEWCLDHGADLNLPDPTPKNTVSERKPILESAAAVGNIATFELLRGRGAPLDLNFGVFPVAVMVTNDSTCGPVGRRAIRKAHGHAQTPIGSCWLQCQLFILRITLWVWQYLQHSTLLDRMSSPGR